MPAARRREPLKVLIADDDPELLAMLSLRYSKLGHQVVEAADGNQALERARAERPELVILDVMMPGRTGWEVARELRHDPDPALRDVRILVLTALGEAMNDMTSPLYGADGWLDKPFDFGTLDAKIAEILARPSRLAPGAGPAAAAEEARAAKRPAADKKPRRAGGGKTSARPAPRK